jgi:hypothetical protein
MRIILAAIFVCAIGLPAASALPTAGPDPVSVSKADSIVHVAKRSRASSSRRSRGASGGSGGIHPLVGSGGY